MSTSICGRDIAAIAICTLAWSTTWYVITWQLGTIDATVSVFYRFALASALLFVLCKVRGEKISLTMSQHRAAIGIGLFTFAIDYALVYLAEERVASAVVAVIWAAFAFVNLVIFRIVLRQRAPRSAWLAAALGVVGVGLLSAGELLQAHMSHATAIGLAFAALSVIGAGFGNLFARSVEQQGVPVVPATAWAMAYGSVLLALYALITHRHWGFDMRWPYVTSLLYLAIIGSVVAFVVYYGLARRHGYTTAAYISAMTPPLAMAISAVFENKRWGGSAFGGVALVMVGQWLLLRSRKA